MDADNFAWLQEWFQSQCNRDWEHENGILLGTIDNPGWFLTVNLQDTELEKKGFQPVDIQRSEDDWVFCKIENGNFEGRCGAGNVADLLEIFRRWADTDSKKNLVE